ncbi:platelet-activating factor acetylhydrolase IB subunit gamma-like [Salmo trutta]|uniref:platelet-activating factor acetylhydrolase IB subunit gamma-like n=1 Tax=Salmo trutta TaxID=8032 RepID=UPI001131C272|nr:platelet-activating factor acetylhydrolase IB subunit gamma-like [Salmo trutta]
MHRRLGVLARGKMPNSLRERNAQVNKLVQEAVSSLPHTSLLNVDPVFVHSDGSISHQELYDYLYLTPQGYQAVCQLLHAHLKGLLEKQAEN